MKKDLLPPNRPDKIITVNAFLEALSCLKPNVSDVSGLSYGYTCEAVEECLRRMPPARVDSSSEWISVDDLKPEDAHDLPIYKNGNLLPAGMCNHF